MKIKMTCYMTGADFEYRPGDVVDFPEAEAKRIISVGGGVALSADEIAKAPAVEYKPTAKPAKAKG